MRRYEVDTCWTAPPVKRKSRSTPPVATSTSPSLKSAKNPGTKANTTSWTFRQTVTMSLNFHSNSSLNRPYARYSNAHGREGPESITETFVIA
jgi:hypothetical protein